jgi:hypothetical protein
MIILNDFEYLYWEAAYSSLDWTPQARECSRTRRCFPGQLGLSPKRGGPVGATPPQRRRGCHRLRVKPMIYWLNDDFRAQLAWTQASRLVPKSQPYPDQLVSECDMSTKVTVRSCLIQVGFKRFVTPSPGPSADGMCHSADVQDHVSESRFTERQVHSGLTLVWIRRSRQIRKRRRP